MSPTKCDRHVTVFVQSKYRHFTVFVQSKYRQQLSDHQGLVLWLCGRGRKGPARYKTVGRNQHCTGLGEQVDSMRLQGLAPVKDFFHVLQSMRSKGKGRRWLLSQRAGFEGQTSLEACDSHCFDRDPELSTSRD